MRGRPGPGRGRGEERDTRHPAPGGGGRGHGRAACKAGSARGGKAGKPRLPRDLVMSSPPPGAASTPTARMGVPALSAPRLEPWRRGVPPKPPPGTCSEGPRFRPRLRLPRRVLSWGGRRAGAEGSGGGWGHTSTKQSGHADRLRPPPPRHSKQSAFPADARPLPREPLRGLVLDILTAGRSSGRDAREGQRGLLVPIRLFRGRAARTSDLCPLHLSFFLHGGGDGRPSRLPRGAGVRLGSGAA